MRTTTMKTTKTTTTKTMMIDYWAKWTGAGE